MAKYRFTPAEHRFIEQSTIPLAIYQFIDQRVVTLALSDGFCRLFGYGLEEAYQLMDNDMYRDTHPDDVARIADAAVQFAVNDTKYNVVYRTKCEGGYKIIHANGTHKITKTGERIAIVWYADEGNYQPGAGGDLDRCGLDLSFSRELHKESMLRQSTYDTLTGLPNMSYFFQLAEAGSQRMREEGKRPALLYLDLNGMRYYNSQNGFAAGDALIMAFSKLLSDTFSNENCSRFEADRFAVYTDAAGLEHRLKQLFADTAQLNGGNSLSVRAGIYVAGFDQTEISSACDRAKYACNTCRGFVSDYRYFDESMLQRVQTQRYIIQNLDRAIRERWIRVYYQPIVRTTSGRVCNEEALVRWVDPTEGLFSASELIRVLEDAKLIYKVDLYVLEEVLQKLIEQKEAGLYIVPQSLNLSRADFDACDIVEEVRARVDAAGVPRDKIVIELTESTVASDYQFMKTQIERFREQGFHVWMDDFGSGYSSLDVLQDIQFDLIKFDMRFLEQFGESEKSRIILSELVKMALALGVETVAEGVENKDQITFLREIGCTKLQGYYYCQAIPMEEIKERYRKGTQIGFENPAERPYFKAIGRINLYDASLAVKETGERHRFFNALPMAIIEADDKGFRPIYGNKSYREVAERSFSFLKSGVRTPFAAMQAGPGSTFANALRDCREEGSRIFFDEELSDGSTVHALVRHVASNPVTKVYACTALVLGVTDASERRLTYTSIAQALSSDYIYLYYVNIETERFIEYSAAPAQDALAVERHGRDFFSASRRDARQALHADDVDAFTEIFTKRNLMNTIQSTGSFTTSYRLMHRGKAQYVSLKAVQMGNDAKHIIIGVNNIDAQMKQQEEIERIRQERIAFGRVSALAGNFLCIYLVNPITDHYTVFSATEEFTAMGLAEKGDFFRESQKNCDLVVHPDDREAFHKAITKENILRHICESGMFTHEHRLMLGKQIRYVRVKAALVEEPEGERLLVGVNDITGQGSPREPVLE